MSFFDLLYTVLILQIHLLKYIRWKFINKRVQRTKNKFLMLSGNNKKSPPLSWWVRWRYKYVLSFIFKAPAGQKSQSLTGTLYSKDRIISGHKGCFCHYPGYQTWFYHPYWYRPGSNRKQNCNWRCHWYCQDVPGCQKTSNSIICRVGKLKLAISIEIALTCSLAPNLTSLFWARP